jgi:hypothetical protein
MNKLYIEYRVYFDSSTNQELLREFAEIVKDRLYDMFDDAEVPKTTDVTYELVMKAEKDND